jgi:Erv1 / Alr family
MNTKMWGPPGWKFLHTITFNYPLKIEENNKDHTHLTESVKLMFENYQNTLPCIYCRKSFKKFLKELPIEPFLGCEKALTYWFYCIHNKVNNKLRGQEWELFIKKLSELLLKNKKIDIKSQKSKINKLKKDILFTKLDPSYDSVCAFYESHRAGCHPSKNKINSCRL